MTDQASVPLLETRQLTRYFRIGGVRGHTLHAVDGVDLRIEEREIVALVEKEEGVEI